MPPRTRNTPVATPRQIRSARARTKVIENAPSTATPGALKDAFRAAKGGVIGASGKVGESVNVVSAGKVGKVGKVGFVEVKAKGVEKEKAGEKEVVKENVRWVNATTGAGAASTAAITTPVAPPAPLTTRATRGRKRKADAELVRDAGAELIAPTTPAEAALPEPAPTAPKSPAQKRTKIQEYMTPALCTGKNQPEAETDVSAAPAVPTTPAPPKTPSKKPRAKAKPRSTTTKRKPPTRATTPIPSTLSALNNLLTAPLPAQETTSTLPAYLTHLVNLHTHLLSSLHLHLAQNGPHSLPTLTTLTPHLERLTRRNVKVEDVRRVCWFSTQGSSGAGEDATHTGGLRLVDYGSGRVVVEVLGGGNGVVAVGGTNASRSSFKEAVTTWCTEFQDKPGEAVKSEDDARDAADAEKRDMKEAEVPMSEILLSENKLLIDNVLRAKGERRKKELLKTPKIRGKKPVEPPVGKTPMRAYATGESKAAVTQTPAKAGKSVPGEKDTVSTPAPALVLVTEKPEARKTSLLDRIRAKHVAALELANTSSLPSLPPPPPTPNNTTNPNNPTTNTTKPEQLSPAEHLLHLSALSRLPSLIPILVSLRLRARGGGVGKCSIGLEEVVTAIRQSVRSGISREEAVVGVRLAGVYGSRVPGKVGRKGEKEEKGEEKRKITAIIQNAIAARPSIPDFTKENKVKQTERV